VRRALVVLALAALAAGEADAQTPSRPGPWALDIRGVASPVPDDPSFYPTLTPTALVPDRGFGLEAGGHVYLMNIGAARLGVGASLFVVRSITNPPTAPAPPPSSDDDDEATAPGQRVQVDVRMLTPQVSFNFGTRNGWSYLSAGAGRTEVRTKTSGAITGRRQAEPVRALNFGGGARWFIRSHLGVGFDVRFHMIGSGTAGAIEQSSPPLVPPTIPAPPTPPVPTPGMRMLTVSGGLSFK
jgi:hypothetical protein